MFRGILFKICIAIGLLAQGGCQSLEKNSFLPYQVMGWTGGDAAYSLALNSHQRLWLFGDSWIGQKNTVSRKGAYMVNNAIAIETIRSNKPNLFSYFWKKDLHNKKGQPGSENKSSFFVNPRKGEWYWPLDGLVAGAKGVIFLNRVVKTKSMDAFGFKVVGTDMALIDKMNSHPKKWVLRFRSLPKKLTYTGVAVSLHNHQVYLFSSTGPQHRIALSRLSVDSLMKGHFDKIKRFNPATKTWKTFSRQNQYPLFDGGPEMSVKYHPQIKKWVALYSQRGLSDKVVVRLASKPQGPWGPEKEVFQCHKKQPEQFCYAAKEVTPLQNQKDGISFIYIVSTKNFWDLFNNLGIYRPQLKSVPWTKLSGQTKKP